MKSKDKYYEYDFWEPDYGAVGAFPTDGEGLNRFGPLLPGKITVSLGEGDTPLTSEPTVGKAFGFTDFYVKDEGTNPTGSFKDRESALVVSIALQKRVKRVVVVSSGNAAVSTAAYARKAGIECRAVIPEKTSQDKQDLIELFGAELVTRPGFYEDVYRSVADEPIEGWNVTSGRNKWRTEASKMIAFELWEAGTVPDVVVVPAANGGGLAGVWKGFFDLVQIGKMKKVPVMIGVQVAGAAPIQVALENNVEAVALGEIEDSVAEGIVASESYCSPKAVRALGESGGRVVAVTDEEILAARERVMELSDLEPEVTAAAVYAGLERIPEYRNKRVVCIQTGGDKGAVFDLANRLAS